jgi:hypothetical protein
LVAISFSVLGFEFQSGVHALEEMYLTAHKALWDQKADWGQKLEAVSRGELPDMFGPENGLYSAESVIEHKLTEIENSVQLLRQATLLMSYHFWEKQVLYWASISILRRRKMILRRRKMNSHESYVAFCQSLDLPIDAEKLETIRLVANVVKHGQGERAWAERLSKNRPEFFNGDVKTSSFPVALLSLSHDLVFELVRALEASGPSAFGNFTGSE